MAVHWNGAGVPDNYAPRAFALFGIPGITLALNVFAQVVIAHDPKRERLRHARALLGLVKWMLVLLPLFVQILMVAHVWMPGKLDVGMLCSLGIGLLLTAMGNYLPKCPPNYTVGIRLPWTLADEDNWKKTHRLGGYVMMAGGLLLTVTALPLEGGRQAVLVPAMVLIPAGIPFIYTKNPRRGHKAHQ